ncbi:MAG: 50S ribosomal protein L18a [Thermoplasmata archaeon]|nr:50S ribosomal protein L18a [Thermoplasmata archaeon]
MPTFNVRGSFYARRDYWQPFTKVHDADSEATAIHWALSEIGGCHNVKRHLIRIDSVSEVVAPPVT